jgi:hypothetical protein
MPARQTLAHCINLRYRGSMNGFTPCSDSSMASIRTPAFGALAIARGLLLLLRPART